MKHIFGRSYPPGQMMIDELARAPDDVVRVCQAMLNKLPVGDMRMTRNLCVDGHEFPQEPGDAYNESSWAGDGECPPFAVFDIDAQRNLLPFYETRAEAEAAMERILAEPDPHLGVVLAWYFLTMEEWDSLGADAQHRLIDRMDDAILMQTGFEGPGCEFDDKEV